MKTKSIYTIVAVLAVVLFAGVLAYEYIMTRIFEPTPTNLPIAEELMDDPVNEEAESTAEDVNKNPGIKDSFVVAENLDIPWEIVFLEDGSYLVTERDGDLLKITEDDKKITKIEGVEHVGEGGLLGMALHPDFENNQYLYLYLTTAGENGLINRVERYKFDGEALKNKQIILDSIPGAKYHDGGRIKFGPDGYIYITTGDATDEKLAQDTNSLAGKILRITDEGEIPEDNPFNNEVYSYGHRNPQGIVWDDQGRLWSSEHGPSVTISGYDEINLIEKGGNYGWPDIKGDETKEGMINPVAHSGPDETWAPADIEFYNGKLYFTGLRGESLYEAEIVNENELEIIVWVRGKYGRIRTARKGPDNALFLLTSNTDGRGNEMENDDKIIWWSIPGLNR